MGRSVLITVGVIFLVLVLCRAGGVRAQAAAAVPPTQAAGRAALPKPAANLTAGTWKYKTTAVQPDGTYNWNHTVTIKDDGERWTVTYLQNIPAGNVTYVQSLEKDTLIVRTLSLNHFAKPGRAWPIIINLNVTDDRVAGTSNRTTGHDQRVAIDLNGPVFGDEAGLVATVGCLPLAERYQTAFRDYDFQKEKERMWQLKVVGSDRVTVAAGTFESYQVELTSADGGPDKAIIWIAKNSHTPVKGLTDVLAGNNGGSDTGIAKESRSGDHIFGTWELIP